MVGKVYTRIGTEVEGNPNLVNGPLSLLETAVPMTDRLFENDYLWKLNVTRQTCDRFGFQVLNESVRGVSVLVQLTHSLVESLLLCNVNVK